MNWLIAFLGSIFVVVGCARLITRRRHAKKLLATGTFVFACSVILTLQERSPHPCSQREKDRGYEETAEALDPLNYCKIDRDCVFTARNASDLSLCTHFDRLCHLVNQGELEASTHVIAAIWGSLNCLPFNNLGGNPIHQRSVACLSGKCELISR